MRRLAGVLVIYISVGILVLTGFSASAQLRDNLNLPESDNKPFYLGIGILYARSHFQISAHPSFLQSDSVLSVNSTNNTGVGLTGFFNFRISKHFHFRVVFPELIFSSQNLVYTLKDPASGNTSSVSKQIESITAGMPLQIKFTSDRIHNFRVYMIAGGSFQYDLASNATARKAQDLVKLKPYDFSVQAGIGLQFYLPMIILSPELKISNGLINVHSRDPNLIYSSVIDKLNSRMIVFSLIIEG